MRLISRRSALAAAGTLAAALPIRKPRADEMQDMSALDYKHPPEPPPDAEFTTADGTTHTLADFLGHGMVVNLWATWCVPCVAELPSLDQLARILAKSDIAVMPLSSDHGGAAAVQKFYASHDITSLPVLLDPHGIVARSWGARGIPTTLIIDKKGREQARLEGSADWSKAADTVRKLVNA